jgi:hypothetical protein
MVGFIFQVIISLEKNSTEGTHVKESLYNEGRSIIKEKLGLYVSSLKEGKWVLSVLMGKVTKDLTQSL